MPTYGSIINGLLQTLPFVNNYEFASVNRSHGALLAGSVVIGNGTAAPTTVNYGMLTTPAAANVAASSPVTLYSTVTPQSSGPPNPMVQNSPAETLSEGILGFLSSGDGIVTTAPTPSDGEVTTVVFIDSIPPKPTLDTVRTSIAEAVTTAGGSAQ